MTGEEFKKWQKKSYGVQYKPEYTDIVGGHIPTGVLLSQIVFWFLPNRKGEQKVTVRIGDRWWIAKTKDQWWLETRLQEKAFNAAVRKLVKLGIVIKKTYHFQNRPAIHISLVWERFLELLDQVLAI
jgi:hypothetical protein